MNRKGRAAADSDAMLVKRVLGGNDLAYGDLYDRYARLVRAICCDATGDLVLAQDLSQEAFLRAYRDLGKLRDPEKFAAWLVGIARMVCREWRRARRRDRHQYMGHLPDCAEGSVSPPNDGRLDAMRDAIRSLPERERVALHTFYLQGQSTEQARAVLGLSRSGFYRVLQKARNRLRRLVADAEESVG